MDEKQIKMINQDCYNIIDKVGSKFFNLEGKTILITGASGMLASYFLDTIRILNEQYFKIPCKVICILRSLVDNYSRLEHLNNLENFVFITQNIAEGMNIETGVDYIIHAASMASPKAYLKNGIETIYTNLNGLISILEYSKKNDVQSILYFSSGEIYGNPSDENIPTREDYEGLVSCTGERACYTETKRFCETLIVNYVKEYNLKVKIVRPWHTFGLGMKLDDGRVIADFIKNGLDNENIKILSDGSATRSFCYITDAHVGFWELLFSNYNGESFNIGNDREEISIRDLAKTVCELFNNKIDYVFQKNEDIEYLSSSPVRCCPDITKANELLNFKPVVTLKSFLERMIEFYMEDEL